MTEKRDMALGSRLDELEVQEHGPGYWDGVMTAAAPELEELRAAAGRRDGRAGSTAAPVRRRLFGGRRRLWIPAACAVAAAAAIVLLFGLPGRGTTTGSPSITFAGPQPASAAEAIRYALGALDRAQAIRGTMSVGKVHDGVFKAGDQVTFLCARDGSFKVTTRTVGSDGLYPASSLVQSWIAASFAYDAPRRRSESVYDYGAKGVTLPAATEDPWVTKEKHSRYVYTAQTEVSAAAPDSRLYTPWTFPIWQVRAYLSTMLGDPHISFTVGRIDGRKVWLLATRSLTNDYGGASGTARRVTIAIDAETRLPLRFSGFQGSHEVRITAAAFSEKPAAEELRLEKPPAAELNDQSKIGGSPLLMAIRYPGLPLDDEAGMRRAVDEMPAFPRWTPQGFSLQEAAAQDQGGSTILPRQAGQPRASVLNRIVTLTYRRGFDAMYVTLRPDARLTGASMVGTPAGAVRADTSDPFVGDVLPKDRKRWSTHTTDVGLKGGSFEGVTAHIVVDPGFWPHLWVKKGGWVATVAGDLTRAQMVRIAASLGPWSGQVAE